MAWRWMASKNLVWRLPEVYSWKQVLGVLLLEYRREAECLYNREQVWERNTSSP